MKTFIFNSFFTFTALFLVCSVCLKAQGTLSYSQALIVGNTSQTVPAGKVWKVTSVYGFDISCDPSVRSSCNWGSNNTVLHFASSYFLVNSRKVFSYNKLFGYAYNTCSTLPDPAAGGTIYSNCAGDATRQGWPDLNPNPNIFPMWLPAGTTLQSGGPNTFVSVLEFAVQQ